MEININFRYILFVLFILLAFIIGYGMGELIGYLKGIIDASSIYRLDNIENVLNISKNVSDNIIMEVNLK